MHANFLIVPESFFKIPLLLAFFTPEYGVSIIVFVSGLSNTFTLFPFVNIKTRIDRGTEK